MKKILFSLLLLLAIATSARAQLPCPSGQQCSGSVTFTVTFAAPPTPVSVSPSSVSAGTAATIITLAAPTGGQFNATMVVQLCAITPSPCASPTALTTTFVSNSSLTATIPAAQLASSGTFAVYIAQPSNGHAQNATPNEIIGPASAGIQCKTCSMFQGETLTTIDSVSVIKG